MSVIAASNLKCSLNCQTIYQTYIRCRLHISFYSDSRLLLTLFQNFLESVSWNDFANIECEFNINTIEWVHRKGH